MDDMDMLWLLSKAKHYLADDIKHGGSKAYTFSMLDDPFISNMLKKHPKFRIERMHMIAGNHWDAIIRNHFPHDKQTRAYLKSDKMSLPIEEYFDTRAKIGSKPLNFRDVLDRLNGALRQLNTIKYPYGDNFMHQQLRKIIAIKP